jgi:hypothetical protein
MKLSDVDETINEANIFDYVRGVADKASDAKSKVAGVMGAVTGGIGQSGKKGGMSDRLANAQTDQNVKKIARGMTRMWVQVAQQYVKADRFKIESISQHTSAILEGIEILSEKGGRKTVGKPTGTPPKATPPKATPASNVTQPNPQKALDAANAKSEQLKVENLTAYKNELGRWIAKVLHINDEADITKLTNQVNNTNPGDKALLKVFTDAVYMSLTQTDTVGYGGKGLTASQKDAINRSDPKWTQAAKDDLKSALSQTVHSSSGMKLTDTDINKLVLALEPKNDHAANLNSSSPLGQALIKMGWNIK